MGRFYAISLLIFVGSIVVSGRVTLPCDHIFSRIPALSAFFEHCKCDYNETWYDEQPLVNAPAVRVLRTECESGMKIPKSVRYHRTVSYNGVACGAGGAGCETCVDKREVIYECKMDCVYENITAVRSVVSSDTMRQTVNVPRSQCESEYVFPAARYLRATNGSQCLGTRCRPCQHKWEMLYMCTPSLQEFLRSAWGLGRRGQNMKSLHHSATDPIIAGDNDGHSRPTRSTHDPENCLKDEDLWCSSIDHSKRSAGDKPKPKPVQSQYQPRVEPRSLPVNPIPFDFAKHHSRFRRQSKEGSACLREDGIRHVLFMLDTSASINETDFKNMIPSLGKLVRHFCNPIRIATLVFNHEQHLKFCFDCYDNNCAGRIEAQNAIQSIQYRAGLTHTAAATRCACETVLTPACGFITDADERACLDVVYITDGQSNDPILDVCETVKCLNNMGNTDLSIYVFGLGNEVNYDELNCIGSIRNDSTGYINQYVNRIFQQVSFPEFSQAIEALTNTFENPPVGIDISEYDCITSNPNDIDGVSGQDCNYTSPTPDFEG